MTPPTGFESAAVIGTGMMGPGIALTLALGGVPSTILSRSSESAARGLETARGQASVLSAAELISESECAAAVELLHASTDFETTVGRAAIVIESAPEDLAFKQELFARLDRLAQPDAVLASNTSGLSITAVASACARPERVLTTHFWNPPHLVPLVEIVLGEKSSPAVAAAVRDLLAACGKTPVIVRRDRPGQLGNRLQMALVREAAHIIAEGIAGAADIDAVIKNGLGLRMPAYGLLEHMDVAGLDLAVAWPNTLVPISTTKPTPRSTFASWFVRAIWAPKPVWAFTIGRARAPPTSGPPAMHSSWKYFGTAGARLPPPPDTCAPAPSRAPPATSRRFSPARLKFNLLPPIRPLV